MYDCNGSDECAVIPFFPLGDCLDGDPCTEGDSCVAGVCTPGTTVSSCTACDDVYDGGRLMGLDCRDDDPCTIDQCLLGVCADRRETCDDGNDCTTDYCSADGCVHTSQPDGFVCEEGDLCTGTGTCDGLNHCSTGEYLGCPFEYCNGNRALTWGCDPDAGCVVVSGAGTCDGECDLWDLCPYTDSLGTDVSSCVDGDTCVGCPTDCPAGDVDGDGIPGDWEANGIDMDCDGTVTLTEESATSDLELDPNVKNVLVEVDWMGEDNGHDHVLDDGSAGLVLVEDAFLTNQAESTILHVHQDQELPHLLLWNHAPPEPTCTASGWVGLNQIKQNPAWFAPWRWGIFHYAISGHDGYNCLKRRSGAGEIWGDDFYVTLGNPDPTSADQLRQEVGTFMHEIGHNHGLVHGGQDPAETKTVNYQSVMSYRYQFPNLTTVDGGVRVPDYSHERLIDLEETELDESVRVHDPGEADLGPDYWLGFDHVDIATGDKYVVLYDMELDATATVPWIDWNQNWAFDIVPVQVDIDGDGQVNAFMEGRNDWAELELLATCNPNNWMLAGAGQVSSGDDELDEETAAELGFLYAEEIVTVDVGPACATSPVAQDGSGKVQVVVFGSATFDPSDLDLATVRVRRAEPELWSVEDVDSDTFDDLLLQLAASDLPHRGNGTTLAFHARETDSRAVLGEGPITWTSSSSDSDSDGVRNACDLCPAQAAPPPDADGCP